MRRHNLYVCVNDFKKANAKRGHIYEIKYYGEYFKCLVNVGELGLTRIEVGNNDFEKYFVPLDDAEVDLVVGYLSY